jgi:hypothetical protein
MQTGFSLVIVSAAKITRKSNSRLFTANIIQTDASGKKREGQSRPITTGNKVLNFLLVTGLFILRLIFDHIHQAMS